MAESPDHSCERLYTILGTSRKDFSLEKIAKYRRSLMLAIHPDHCSFPHAGLMCSMVNYAFNVLSNEAKRKYYDRYSQPSPGERIDELGLSKALFHLNFAISIYNRQHPDRFIGTVSNLREPEVSEDPGVAEKDIYPSCSSTEVKDNPFPGRGNWFDDGSSFSEFEERPMSVSSDGSLLDLSHETDISFSHSIPSSEFHQEEVSEEQFNFGKEGKLSFIIHNVVLNLYTWLTNFSFIFCFYYDSR